MKTVRAEDLNSNNNNDKEKRQPKRNCIPSARESFGMFKLRRAKPTDGSEEHDKGTFPFSYLYWRSKSRPHNN